MNSAWKLLSAASLVSAAMFTTGAADAQVVAGVEPVGSYVGTWVNRYDNQNFLVQFTLASDTVIGGASIWTGGDFSSVGQAVTIRFRADSGGSPAAANLYEFNDTIDSNVFYELNPDYGDIYISTATFAPITLSAGTYWFGMSGFGSELTWVTYDNGEMSPVTQYQLDGETVFFHPNISSLTYRLLAPSDVPEPASWLMMIGGFGMVGGALRRRATRVSFG